MNNLPNTLWLSKSAEERLKKQKEETGLTPNIGARLAFFKSVESGFVFDPIQQHPLNGALKLDKVTWLGKTQMATELMLKMLYPQFNEKEMWSAWAAHVNAGLD